MSSAGASEGYKRQLREFNAIPEKEGQHAHKAASVVAICHGQRLVYKARTGVKSSGVRHIDRLDIVDELALSARKGYNQGSRPRRERSSGCMFFTRRPRPGHTLPLIHIRRWRRSYGVTNQYAYASDQKNK